MLLRLMIILIHFLLKRSVLFVTMAVAAVVWPVSAQTQYTGDGTPTGLEEEIRWRMNRGRFDAASENLARGTTYTDVPASSGPLAPNQCLTLAARHHSEDMAKNSVFQHETVPGSAYYNPLTQPQPWDRMNAEGYNYNWAAENIAAGYSGAEAVYVGWWNSAGHRANMYSAALREVGDGYFYWSSSTYRSYYTMDLGSSGSSRFFTDTVFNDLNGNGSYEQGEGVGGIAIRLVVAGAAFSSYDLSSTVGSFAVPIQAIAAGITVQVVLSNTTARAITLSIPRDYRTCSRIALAPGEAQVVGGFTQPGSGNLGFRNLSPVQQPLARPTLNLARSGTDMLLSWASQTNLQYQVQWTDDFRFWSNVTAGLQSGTGGNLSCRDTGAVSRARAFYRLLVTRP